MTAFSKHKKFNPLPHLLVWGILLSLSVIMFSYKTAEDNQDIRGRAEEEDPNFCQNHCKPDAKRCDFNDTSRHEDDPIINDPCCEEIARTGDPGACPWPQRGYCTDDQCAAIPEGVNRQRCGGPRHSWCNLCNEKCPGYGNAPQPTQPPPPTATVYVPPPTTTSIPTVFIPPTAIPLPTTNYQLPTTIPPAYVTVVLQPTSVIFPTQPPISTLTPTPTPKKITLPQILPPKEKVTAFLDILKTQLMAFLTNILP
ncbi:hypothetical protein HY945_01885 [Candidatus Gottesmanbacteria bacterium]|nr:hypothetical protein [Candidatus Gottesmanbacteria bacterium]